MNVLFIGLYPPHIGGIATHTFNLGSKLTDMGHNLYVLTYKDHLPPVDENIMMVDTWPRFRGLSFIRNAPKMAEAMIKEHDIDIVHSHYLAPPGYVGSKMTEKIGIPSVITAHGSDINFMYKSTIGKYLINLALKNSNHVICVSKSLQRQLGEISDTPSTHIPNGVDTSRFIPSETKKEYLLYIGALIAQKNVDTVIDALAGSKERFVVAGDGTQRPRLEWLAEKRKVNATFTGYVENVPELLERAKALVFPSSEEGFGLAVLEAMAAGVPTISKRGETIQEIVTDRENGFLYDRDEELIPLLAEIDSDTALRDKIINNGIETAKNYTWEYVAKRTIKIYEEVIGRFG